MLLESLKLLGTFERMHSLFPHTKQFNSPQYNFHSSRDCLREEEKINQIK